MSQSVNTIDLPIEIRTAGKGSARALRRKRFTPGVVYGAGLKNTEVALDERLLEKYATLGNDNQLFQLTEPTGALKGKVVVLKAVQRHPVSRQFLHVDLQAVEPSKVFRKDVRIDFSGTPIGVKEGGTFQVTRRRVRIACTPQNLPAVLTLDISELKIKGNFSAKDIPLPEGVTLITRPEITLCTCAK